MGFGDEIMGSGMARGAAARGKLIAFGNGQKIIWSQWAKEIYLNNPNVARPGQEHLHAIEWVRHYKGHRLYVDFRGHGARWNPDFRAQRGEFFFTPTETMFAPCFVRDGFVLIEPYSKVINKDWPLTRYQAVADGLQSQGIRVVQFIHDKTPEHRRLAGVEFISPPTFRVAAAMMRRAALYIGPEGGLHHAAAAVGIPAVVLFGGVISPQTTGYDDHVNLFTGETACGKLNMHCEHCIEAMRQITVEMVLGESLNILSGGHHAERARHLSAGSRDSLTAIP